jgi:hypothetical protein
VFGKCGQVARIYYGHLDDIALPSNAIPSCHIALPACKERQKLIAKRSAVSFGFIVSYGACEAPMFFLPHTVYLV